MTKYDDATWHSGGDFPEDSPPEYGGTHIALLLRWLFQQGFAGELHLREDAELLRKVVNGTARATNFLFDRCDGKLTSEDVNEAGRKFLDWYAAGGGRFLDDYGTLFCDQIYTAGEYEHDWDAFSSMVSRRYKEFLAR